MKLRSLINPDFKTVTEKLIQRDIPISVAWKLAKITAKANENINAYESARLALVKKLAKKDENGVPVENSEGKIAVDESNMEQFIKEIGELQDQEVEMPKISVAELGSSLEMKAQDLMALSDILVD